MKKLVLAAVCLGFWASPVFAQKKQVTAAINYLNDKKLEEAKTAIEAAINDESTKNDAKTWYVRGTVYMALQQEAPEGSNFYKEAHKSYKRTLELKPDFEKTDMDNKLFALAIYNFNDGVAAYNNSKHEAAFEHFGEVVNIQGMEGGKRFAAQKGFDTMARQAILHQGYAAYYSKNYDAAIPLLERIKNDPVVKGENTFNVYLMLADMYELKKDNAKALQTFAEGKQAFPGEKAIINAELNYYIKSGQADQLIAKLEEALKGEPTNPDMLYLLGTAYDQMANPKDQSGNSQPKPANYNELVAKAEKAYEAAIAAKSDHADAIYNLGALYYNRAVSINDEMNTLVDKGNDKNGKTNQAAIDKKFTELKAERDAWFTKALPNLERTIATYDAKAASLSGSDKDAYYTAVFSAKTIYGTLNSDQAMKTKYETMKKKLESMK